MSLGRPSRGVVDDKERLFQCLEGLYEMAAGLRTSITLLEQRIITVTDNSTTTVNVTNAAVGPRQLDTDDPFAGVAGPGGDTLVIQGAPGPRGLPGLMGLMGFDGEDGQDGLQGAKGETGGTGASMPWQLDDRNDADDLPPIPRMQDLSGIPLGAAQQEYTTTGDVATTLNGDSRIRSNYTRVCVGPYLINDPAILTVEDNAALLVL